MKVVLIYLSYRTVLILNNPTSESHWQNVGSEQQIHAKACLGQGGPPNTFASETSIWLRTYSLTARKITVHT